MSIIKEINNKLNFLTNHIYFVNKLNYQFQIFQYWQNELRSERNQNDKRLLKYGKKVYSQNDEDGIIEEIFRRIGTTNKRFIEFGVESGVQCNTLKLLLEDWSGLWIECEKENFPIIHKCHSQFINENRLKLDNSFISCSNINSIFSRNNFEGEIDLLSIDTDLNDYWFWDAISVISPRVVVIEYNASWPPPLSIVVPYSEDGRWQKDPFLGNYFGASLSALTILAKKKGYSLVGCNFSGINAFFVRSDLCSDLFLSASVEDLYEPPRYFFSSITNGHQEHIGPVVTIK